MRRGTPELLFIKRASRSSDRWSSHLAFPGGRSEPEDDDGHFTALRETWEETGLDLAEKEFLSVGGLDDREITTSLGRRLLMILSPYVFLCTSPRSPAMDLQPSEVASAHWIPLPLLTGGKVTRWGDVKVDIASRLAPRSRTIRVGLRLLIGSMHFQCILLPDRPDAATGLEREVEEDEGKGKGKAQEGEAELRLWGLTLGMTLVRSVSSSALGRIADRGGGAQDLVHFMSAFPTVQHPSPATYPFFAADPSATAITSSSSPTSEPQPATVKKRSDSASSSSAASVAAVRKSMALEELNTLSPGTKSLAPSMTSIFPRFTCAHLPFPSLCPLFSFGADRESVDPDINFLIWLFGGRYRRLLKRWTHSHPSFPSSTSASNNPFNPSSAPQTPGLNNPWSDRRVSWAGVALGQFYTAVRKALVVVILVRAVVVGGGVVGCVMWVRKVQERRRMLVGR